MEKLADSIDLAEKRVAERKAAMLREYDALEAKVRRAASSPKVLGGVLIGTIALAYFVIAGRGKPKRVVVEKGGRVWPQVLRTAQVLLPLVGALKASKAADAAKSAKKKVSKATGTPPAPHDAGE